MKKLEWIKVNVFIYYRKEMFHWFIYYILFNLLITFRHYYYYYAKYMFLTFSMWLIFFLDLYPIGMPVWLKVQAYLYTSLYKCHCEKLSAIVLRNRHWPSNSLLLADSSTRSVQCRQIIACIKHSFLYYFHWEIIAKVDTSSHLKQKAFLHVYLRSTTYVRRWYVDIR